MITSIIFKFCLHAEGASEMEFFFLVLRQKQGEGSLAIWENQRGFNFSFFSILEGVNDDVKKKPTWEGFLRALTDLKDLSDSHWSPISYLCNPCMYNFDFFIDLANLTTESEALLTEVKQGWDLSHLIHSSAVKSLQIIWLKNQNRCTLVSGWN